MANRWFQQFRFSLEKYVVDLYAHVTFGAAGAPTLDAPNSKGIASITRTGVGAYDIVLQDSYYRFLMANDVWLAAAPAAQSMHVTAQAVGSLPSPSISIQFRDAAGAAVDPAVGDQSYLQFSLSNSSAL